MPIQGSPTIEIAEKKEEKKLKFQLKKKKEKNRLLHDFASSLGDKKFDCLVDPEAGNKEQTDKRLVIIDKEFNAEITEERKIPKNCESRDLAPDDEKLSNVSDIKYGKESTHYSHSLRIHRFKKSLKNLVLIGKTPKLKSEAKNKKSNKKESILEKVDDTVLSLEVPTPSNIIEVIDLFDEKSRS